MKASLFAEDDDEDDQDQGLMKSAMDSSARRLVPRVQTRPSGRPLRSAPHFGGSGSGGGAGG